MLVSQMLFKSFFILISFVSTSFALEPRSTGASHEYKRYFLKNEDQSCQDIRDSRGSFKSIHFCTLKAPLLGVPTTISFWGWDQGRTTSAFKGLVHLHSVAENGEEKDLYDFTVDSGGNYVQWYHHDFVINSTNITNLHLYYQIVESNGRQLNLRDVWVRPTEEDSGERPPRKCNDMYHSIGVVVSVFSGVILLLFSYGEDRPSFLNVCSLSFFRIGRLFSPFVLVSSAMLTSYVDGYPYSRCKDDGFLVAVGVVFLIGLVVTSMYTVYLWYHPPTLSMLGMATSRVAPSPLDELPNEEDIIKAATTNSHKRMEAGSAMGIIQRETHSDRKIYKDVDDNECAVCMECFDIVNRVGIVLKCGHVFCAKCLSKMRTCATCRVDVKLQDLTLLSEESTHTTKQDTPTTSSSKARIKLAPLPHSWRPNTQVELELMNRDDDDSTVSTAPRSTCSSVQSGGMRSSSASIHLDSSDIHSTSGASGGGGGDRDNGDYENRQVEDVNVNILVFSSKTISLSSAAEEEQEEQEEK